jgi:modulator of FtsH protease HflC
LPDKVSENVYQRMSSERKEEAQELRSTGTEIAEGIKADADRQKIVIEAEAYRDAELIRGEGDAQAAAIYAAAYNKNPEFYDFTRSLNAYRSTFANEGDLMLLSPDSDFFKYLKSETRP